MLGTLLAIIVYGAIALGLIDLLLYGMVKIKERHRKSIEKNETNTLIKENDSKNVPS